MLLRVFLDISLALVPSPCEMGYPQKPGYPQRQTNRELHTDTFTDIKQWKGQDNLFHICNRNVGSRATIYIPTPTTPCHRVQRLSKLNTVIILIECIQGDHMTDAKKINIYIHHY